MLDDFLTFILSWLIVVGGIALVLFTIRVLYWLIEVILFGGW